MSDPEGPAPDPTPPAVPLSGRAVKSRVVAGVAWLGTARLLTAIIGLASTIILARLLTPADFGLVAIATATLALIQAATQLSLTSALISHSAIEDDHINTAFTLSLLRSALLLVVIVVASPWLSAFYGDERLLPIFIVVGVTGVLPGMTNPRISLQSRDLSFRPQFIVQTTLRVLTFVFSVGFALATRSYWALVLSPLAATLISLVVSYAIAPFRPKLRLNKARELIGFSAWVTLSEIIIMLGWRFDQLLIGYFLPKADLGAYVVAENLAAVPTREPLQPINQTLFPGFAKIRDDKERFARGFRLAQATIVAITFPLGFGFAAVADPLVRLALGEKWLSTIPIIEILSGTFAVVTSTVALQGVALALQKPRVLFWRDLRSLVLRTPVAVLGLWYAGLMGIVYARAASAVVGTVFNMWFLSRLTGVSIRSQLGMHAVSAVGTAAMVGTMVALRGVLPAGSDHVALVVQIAVPVAVGGLVYLAIRVAAWHAMGRPHGPDTEMLRLARQVRGKLRRR